ncbi:MAG: response regulator [Lentisphaerae bacterium]|nr:response regulator [Lentisphaerota bacterium]
MKADNLKPRMIAQKEDGIADTPHCKVLVVDDEKSIRISLREFLLAAGYEANVAEDAQAARKLLADGDYDVVVSDIVLPGVSGVTLLKAIRAASPDVQVIVMTGEPTVETASEAVRAGASDYLTKPIAKDAILAAVSRAAASKQLQDENRHLHAENQRYQERLELMVAQRTTELSAALEGTIRAMANMVESRDPYTAGHQQRVSRLAQSIAETMGLPEEEVRGTYFAGLIHDIGKIGVPTEILTTPVKLCKEAIGMIRKHPGTGSRILGNIQFPWPLAEIIHQHHERMDGSGYPMGLAGPAIRMEARILAVSDVVEAMAGHRPYRAALGIEAALEEIETGRGLAYDAAVVDACLLLFREKGFSLVDMTGIAGERR